MLAGMTTGGMAQTSLTPGQQFQENGSVSGSAGAPGYTPGQQFRTNGSIDGKAGASGYAPGRATTGASVDSQTGVKAGGAKLHTGIGAGAKAKVK
jgi:hypothetical protein